jgi:hypothetical protein
MGTVPYSAGEQMPEFGIEISNIAGPLPPTKKIKTQLSAENFTSTVFGVHKGQFWNTVKSGAQQ